LENIVDDLMPSGVPYGAEKLSEREQVLEYQRELRGNITAWQQWIEEKSTEIQNQMNVIFDELKVEPAFVAQIHPYDIAIRMAVAYSSTMENKLAKYEDETFDRIEAEGRPSQTESAMTTFDRGLDE
jgi:LPS sulfotransferase NodH